MATTLQGFVRVATGRVMEFWGRFAQNARLIANGRIEQAAGEAMLVRARIEPSRARAYRRPA